MSIFIQINIWMAILLGHVRQLPHGCWTFDNVAMGMSTGTMHKVLPAVLNMCMVCACMRTNTQNLKEAACDNQGLACHYQNISHQNYN